MRNAIEDNNLRKGHQCNKSGMHLSSAYYIVDTYKAQNQAVESVLHQQ
ncbi:MAG: hypothetical protein KJN68_01450 [Bacteroidia bacterium]|nr:hypothetical protein [Bacteroidia bacterium]